MSSTEDLGEMIKATQKATEETNRRLDDITALIECLNTKIDNEAKERELLEQRVASGQRTA